MIVVLLVWLFFVLLSMHFIDEAKIYLKSGDGGVGSSSFRREKFIEYGGPDGGNGGKGGNIAFRANPNLNTLIDFRYKQHFKAEDGKRGSGANRTGASGQDIIIEVPLWTQIYDEFGTELLLDIDHPDQEHTMLKGGDGGLGNSNFKTSTNRAPRRHTIGWPGKELWVWLKLKLLSDIGLLGMPNAGKSTFLSAVSAARPKIADYPFTTIKPQLGIAYIDNEELVIADIPGLIKGASDGSGLGHKFLKHLERCRILLHLVDVNNEDYIDNYKTVRAELEMYSHELSLKKELIVLTKSDTVTNEESELKAAQFEHVLGQKAFCCSATSGYKINDVLRMLCSLKRSAASIT